MNSIFYSFFNSTIDFGNDTIFEGNTAFGNFVHLDAINIYIGYGILVFYQITFQSSDNYLILPEYLIFNNNLAGENLNFFFKNKIVF